MKHELLMILLLNVVIVTACSALEEQVSVDRAGDAARGEVLFRTGRGEDVPSCSTCHRVGTGGFGMSLGPNLVGITTYEATRIDGMTTEAYIRDSILNPDNFIVPGFRVSMYNGYAEHLMDQDIADLVAYIMSL